jgi:hypothetical protein
MQWKYIFLPTYVKFSKGNVHKNLSDFYKNWCCEGRTTCYGRKWNDIYGSAFKACIWDVKNAFVKSVHVEHHLQFCYSKERAALPYVFYCKARNWGCWLQKNINILVRHKEGQYFEARCLFCHGKWSKGTVSPRALICFRLYINRDRFSVPFPWFCPDGCGRRLNKFLNAVSLSSLIVSESDSFPNEFGWCSLET